MPKLRVMSGSDVVKIIESFGFSVVGQRGSHIKLQRFINKNVKQIATVPNHKEIDKGTLKAIMQQLSQFIPEAELRKLFYTGS